MANARRPKRQFSIGAVVVILLFLSLTSAVAAVSSTNVLDAGEEDLSNPRVTRTTLSTGGDPSMQLNAFGNPVIAYTDHVEGVGGLRLIHCDDPACSGGGETISMLDPVANGNYSSLQLDRNGSPSSSTRAQTPLSQTPATCG